ncbi:MAG: hypothetical protein KJ905_01350 [Nanoarchaeota archaeon]|nr:hypothetical protein [Nanoarchaeota archaeon]
MKYHPIDHAPHHTKRTNHKRGLVHYLMENKNLVVAIVVVFVLIIIVGAFFLFIEDGKEVAPKDFPTVNSLVQTCDELCAGENVDTWCDFELSSGENSARGSCYGFAFSPLYTELGVKKCPAIDCNNRPEKDWTCSGLGGVWEAPTAGGGCEQTGDAERYIETDATDSPPVVAQICCSAVRFFS